MLFRSTWVHTLVTGDRYVLCSDGIVDEVDDPAIAEVLAVSPDPQAAADALVALANQNGGHDNTTVVVIDVLEGAAEAPIQVSPDWQTDQPRMVDADERSTPGALGNPHITVQDDDGDTGVRWGSRRARRRRTALALVAVALVLLAAAVTFLVVGSGSNDPVDSTSTTVMPSTTTSTVPSTAGTETDAPTLTTGG